MAVHPTAIVEDGARLGAGVEIGPFCIVGRDAVLGDGVRLLNDGVFRALHARHVLRLLVNGAVPVNDAETALARQGNGEFGLRDGVHGRGENRHIQAHGGQFGGNIDIPRQHLAQSGKDKDVVET